MTHVDFLDGICKCRPACLSRTLKSPLVVLSIFALFAGSRIFSANMMWVYTSCPRYFSALPRSSVLILISAISLSNSGADFSAFSTSLNSVLNACANLAYLVLGVEVLLNQVLAGEPVFSQADCSYLLVIRCNLARAHERSSNYFEELAGLSHVFVGSRKFRDHDLLHDGEVRAGGNFRWWWCSCSR